MSGVTEIIVLRANQVLQLQVGSHDGRPTFAEYTHEELLGTLVRKERKSSSRRSKTVETKASRTIGLLGRAILTGAWTTGVAINRTEAFDKLINILSAVERPAHLTVKARALIAVLTAKHDIQIDGMIERQNRLYVAFNR